MPTIQEIRAFIAFRFDPKVTDRLFVLIQELRKKHPEIRPVASANIHLTFHFFEALDEPALEKVKESCLACTRKERPVSLVIQGFGVFPDLQHPRILWAGISEGRPDVIRLKEALDEELLARKIPIERRLFAPHLTIGRIRGRVNSEDLKESLALLGNSMQVADRISELCLIKSTLKSEGPVYEVLAAFPLEGEAL